MLKSKISLVMSSRIITFVAGKQKAPVVVIPLAFKIKHIKENHPRNIYAGGFTLYQLNEP